MPQLKPRLTVRAIRPLVSGLRECGHDVAPILAAVGIDDAILDDPDSHPAMTWCIRTPKRMLAECLIRVGS